VVIQKGTVMAAVSASGGEMGNLPIISVLISSRDSGSILCFPDPVLRIILTIGFGKDLAGKISGRHYPDRFRRREGALRSVPSPWRKLAGGREQKHLTGFVHTNQSFLYFFSFIKIFSPGKIQKNLDKSPLCKYRVILLITVSL